MDAAILVVIFLLVTAASLASYLSSQWSAIRSGDMSIGWVAISSLGVTLLLVAAAVAVITLGLAPTLRLFSNNNEPAEQRRGSAQVDAGLTERGSDRRKPPTEASNTTISAAASTDRVVSIAESRSGTEGHQHRDQIGPASAPSSPQSPGVIEAAASRAAPRGASVTFTNANPWAATNCVHAVNPDPADLTRWTIENECGIPVGMVFASCMKSPVECSGLQSTSWEYPIDGMVLPGKARRPVTSEEETRYGRQIRYIACAFATSEAIELIGQSSETRSSTIWAHQFEAARRSDTCLMSVRQGSDVARRSGQSIEVVFGASTPGKVRPAPAGEF